MYYAHMPMYIVCIPMYARTYAYLCMYVRMPMYVCVCVCARTYILHLDPLL